jgi:hypothetical protein
MGKLYLKNSEVAGKQILNEELLSLVEGSEKQKIFRSLYDIEIMGIVVYYKKNWCYENLAQKEDQNILAGVSS